MKAFNIVLLFLLSTILFANTAGTETEEIIGIIPFGDKEDELKYSTLLDNPMQMNGPNSISFDAEGLLYIHDHHKDRFVVVNSLLEVVNIVKYAPRLFVNSFKQFFVSTNSIYGHSTGYFIGAIDKSGNPLFNMNFYNAEFLRNEIDEYNFIIIENNAIYFDKDNNPIVFYELGNNVRENLNKINRDSDLTDLLIELSVLNPNSNPLTQYTLIGNNFVEPNTGNILTTNYSTYLSYWKEQNLGRTPPENIVNLKRKGVHKGLEGFYAEYLSTDSDGNKYWLVGNYTVLVFDKLGWNIDLIRPKIYSQTASYAVHPNGDIYILDYDEEKATIYRIQRRW